MQFVQVEGVDAFLGPYHQELVCRHRRKVRGCQVLLAQAKLLLLLYPWPTSSHRVNPSDRSMDLQGAAIEDLGEAGAHLGRK